MQFVENKGAVLTRASSLWATYGAIVLFLGDKFVEYLRSPAAANLTWKDAALGVLLVAIPFLRIVQQESLQPPAIEPMKESRP